MKTRIDFVTNSSSSSFILTHFDREIFENLLEEEKEKFTKEFGEGEASQWYLDLLKEFRDFSFENRFDVYSMEELEEVFSWYEEEVLGEILQVECQPYSNREQWEKQIRCLEKALQEKHSDLTIKRMTAYIIFVLEDYYRGDNIYQKTFIMEKFEGNLHNYIKDGFIQIGVEIKPFIVENIEKIKTIAKEFDGWHMGNILACFFDAKYIYYQGTEILNELEEILKKSGNCKYSCRHMG